MNAAIPLEAAPHSIAEAEQQLRRGDRRAYYEFDIPAGLAASTGIKTVALVELNSGEELMAANRSQNSIARLGWELAKESLREVNGDPVDSGSGTVNAFWGRQVPGMPQLRQLIVAAYQDIHNPKNDDVKAFFASRRVRTG